MSSRKSQDLKQAEFGSDLCTDSGVKVELLGWLFLVTTACRPGNQGYPSQGDCPSQDRTVAQSSHLETQFFSPLSLVSEGHLALAAPRKENQI